MTKRNTRRALLMSALSMLLCVSMLIGSTFAWFTDSVTSSGNKIQSGTLKLDLELLDKESNVWNSIKEDQTALFNHDKWEPGYTEAKVLKVVNDGSLALKWYAKFVSAGEVSKLADAIDVYVNAYGVLDDAAASSVAYPANRDLDGYTKVGTLAEFINTIQTTTCGNLKEGESAYLGLALKMQEEAGNEYQGLDLAGAFDIQIFATQDTVEEDSFDNQYDDITFVNTAAALKEALEAGEHVMLTDDIVANFEGNYILVPADADVVLDLNGYDIAATTTKTDGAQCVVTVRGNMDVTGNGTVSIATGTLDSWANRSAVFSVEGNGELTLNKGVTLVNEGGFKMAYGVDVLSGIGAPTLNINGATIVSPYTGVRLFNNSKTYTTTVNYNAGVVYGETRDIWAQVASSNSPAENAIVNIADGITYTTTTQESGGVIYQMDQTASYVMSAEGLASAIAAGGDVVLTDDINMDVATTAFSVANGSAATLDLNGHDIIATSDTTEGVQLFSVNGTLDIVGDGTISLTSDNFAWTDSYRYTAINIRENGVVTLGDGVNVVCEASKDGDYGMSYAVDIYTTGTLNVEGASLHSNYIAVRSFYGNSVINVGSGSSITSSRNNWGIWPQSGNPIITIASDVNYTVGSYGIYIFE